MTCKFLELRLRIARPEMSFSAAHFTIFAPGLRERLHGHDYQVAFEYCPPEMKAGKVLDYRIAKSVLKKLCLELNEKTLLPRLSPFLEISEGERDVEFVFNGERFVLPRGDVHLMDLFNITLEELSKWFADNLRNNLLDCGADFRSLSVCVTSSGDQSAECLVGDGA